VRVAAAFGGLAFAAYTDVKTREVPDGLWAVLGAAGLALFALDLSATFGGQAWVLAVPVGLLYAVAMTGGEIIEVVPGDEPPPEGYELNAAEKRRLRTDIALSAAMVGGALAVFAMAGRLDLGTPGGLLDGPQAQAYGACLMFGLALLLFFLSLIAGGADAKALMTLAVLFPAAPAFAGLPLIHAPTLAAAAVPFALAAFFNGAILLVLARLPVAPIVSLRRGEFRVPDSFFGAPKPVERINLEREWVLGAVIDGAFVRRLMPTHGTHSDDRQKEALRFLADRGDKTAFVTPKVPFMVYLLAGLAVLVVLSCPLYFLGAWR
jgi:hypothetical protein